MVLIFSVVMGFFACILFMKNMSSRMIMMLYFLMNVIVFSFIPLKIELVQSLTFFSGVGFIGFVMMVLSLYIISIVYLSQYELNKSLKSKGEMGLISSLIIYFSFMSFLVLKIFYFYVFFELSLVPMFLMILGWGYQPERLKASLMMLFYTLTASLPLLVVLIWMSYYGIVYFDQIVFFLKSGVCFSGSLAGMMVLFIFMSFMVKLPMFLVHLWLPQAHVEAPSSGSMILAAVLLKLGGYGLIRFNMFITHQDWVCKMLFSISVIGGAMVSLSCVQQVDLKVIVAYSSVAHMAMMIVSSMTSSSWGIMGSVMILLSHGFTSSGMFYGVNVVYRSSGSRSVFINKGMLIKKPLFVLWWALLCCSNMGSPPTLNLISEILSCVSLYGFSMMTFLSIFLFLVMSVYYNLSIYNTLCHGEVVNKNVLDKNGSIQENLVLFNHLIPVYLGLLYLFMFFSF